MLRELDCLCSIHTEVRARFRQVYGIGIYIPKSDLKTLQASTLLALVAQLNERNCRQGLETIDLLNQLNFEFG